MDTPQFRFGAGGLPKPMPQRPENQMHLLEAAANNSNIAKTGKFGVLELLPQRTRLCAREGIISGIAVSTASANSEVA
jgi:hypothetical protein